MITYLSSILFWLIIVPFIAAFLLGFGTYNLDETPTLTKKKDAEPESSAYSN